MTNIPPGFTATGGQMPRTGERKLYVAFRYGSGAYIDTRNEYTAKQIRWNDTGENWDAIAVRLV